MVFGILTWLETALGLEKNVFRSPQTSELVDAGLARLVTMINLTVVLIAG